MATLFRKWAALFREHRQAFHPSRLLSMLLRKSTGRGSIALFDQVMISGSNFVANIVLVRGLGLAEFGKYYLAYVIILYANAVQMSFVTAPMLVVAPMLVGKEKNYFLRGMLALQVSASFLLLFLGLAASFIIHRYNNYFSLQCLIAISCSIGAFQLQDWVRRYYFIVHKKHLAVVSDTISYFFQLVILAVLWQAGFLTLARTFWVMSVTSVAAFLLGPITDRISPAFDKLRESWHQCKGLSRDLLISNQVRWFGSQGLILIGTAIVGPAGIGGLRATQSLAGPVSLVLSSLDNVLPIRIGEILKTEGTAGAYAFTRKAMLLATLALSLLLVPVVIFGRPILRVVYGPAVVAFYVPMLLQLASVVIDIACRLWLYLYRGVRDTRAVLRANVVCSVTSVVCVYILGRLWNATGIVMASLLGQFSILVYCIYHWRRYREELLARYVKPSPHGIGVLAVEDRQETRQDTTDAVPS